MRRSLLTLGAAALAAGLFGSTAMAQVAIPDITTKMTGVSGDLAKVKTGEPVQTQQKEIVRDLDELIASLEKECENCRKRHEEEQPEPRHGRLDDQPRLRRQRPARQTR